MGLGVAFRSFFSALFNPDASRRIAAALEGETGGAPAEPPAPSEPAKPRGADQPDPRSALALLSVLQTEGRLVDFLMEDIEGAEDADIGVATRGIHEACQAVLKKYFTLEPVRDEEEGDSITVDKDYDPARLRVIGSVGAPPFSGTLRHRGWRVTATTLPTLTGDESVHRIIAPAELETDG